MAEYIEREAVEKVIEGLAGGFEYIECGWEYAVEKIKEVPAADVRPVDKLTINAIMLLETCPEVINELAERICTKLDDAVLNGIKFCADIREVEND